MSDCIIGIDISKHHLDLHRLPDGATRRVSNSPKGLRELISWIATGLLSHPAGSDSDLS